MRVDEVGQQFDLDLEHEDVDSVSGLVLTLLGRPPQVGDTVRYERLQFEVTAVKGHGVDRGGGLLIALGYRRVQDPIGAAEPGTASNLPNPWNLDEPRT